MPDACLSCRAKTLSVETPFWYIIANPAAHGGAMEKSWPKIEQALQAAGLSYTVQFTQQRGHAIRLVEDILLKGGRYILAIGGDGTNHEVVHGLFAQKFVPPSEVTYALLPFGTGNDWAREHKIPFDVPARLERLKNPQIAFQDIGHVTFQKEGNPDSAYFVNVAGMAYDGYIGKKLLEHPASNRVQYLLMVAQYLFAYKLAPGRIYFDGRQADDFFYTINIGLCRYSAGGMQLVPQAVPDDGLFALTFARKLSKLEVLLQTRNFYNGTLLRHPKIEGCQARSIRVEHTGKTPILLEADGEFLGETPVEFTLLEKALRFAL